MNDGAGQPPGHLPPQPSAAPTARPRPLDGRPRKRKQSKPKRGRGLLYMCLAVLLLLAAGIGVVTVQLMHGGMSLASVIPMLERALSEDVGENRIRIQTADLKLDEERRLVLSLGQIALVEPGGKLVAQAPEARGVISWAALRRGRLAVSRLDLVSPRLNAIATEQGLTLSFARSAAPTANPTPAIAAAAPSAQSTAAGPSAEERGVDVFKMLSEGQARARRRETSTGFLRELGLRHAVVVVASGTHRTVWNVPALDVSMRHNKTTSAIQARASIATLTGPLVITANVDDSESGDQMTIGLEVEGFNPRGVARLIPGIGFAETIDMPFAGSAKLRVGNDGVLKTADIEAQGQSGEARFGLLGRKPVPLEATRLALSYDGPRRTIDIKDMTFGWAGNALSLVGQMVEDVQPALGWSYALRSSSGTLAAPRAAQKAVRIDQAQMSGRINPQAGRFSLADLSIRAANAEVTAKGDVAWTNGAPAGEINGRLSPMSVAVMTALWPSVLAPNVRNWVSTHVTRGQMAGGLFKTAIGNADGEANARLSLTLEASGVEIQTVKGMPPIDVARGLVRVEGQTIEITTPEVTITATDGQKLQFRAARFTAVETAQGDQPTAEVAFRLAGPLSAALDLADRDPLKLLRTNGFSALGIDGKLDGNFKATFPMAENLQWSEVRQEGRLRVTELRVRQALAGNDVSGGTINVDLGDKVVDVKGDVLVKGVTGKVGWQYITNQPLAQQPPARLSVVLDNADRAALGLDVADLVLGETPVEVLVSFSEAGAQPRVRVDLTKSELMFEPIGWKKAPGRAATFVFDPVKGPGTGAAQRLELQNIKLTGDDIAMEGWIAIGPDNKPREFSFPELALNVVSRLNVHGKRKPDGVWDITAKGPTFDGRTVFRGMFNVGQAPSQQQKAKPGFDLNADIDTVIGFSDTVVRGVKLRLGQRLDRMTELDAKATLATGKPFIATLVNQQGVGRQLRAEGADAGQVFKLVGFYPSAVGGNMKLQVNLDAKGANEKSGVLFAEDFAVLGDSIVGELYQNADSQPTGGQGPNQPKRAAQPRAARQQFDFDGLRIPFDVGSGQFVMNNAVLRGPLIGATFRGKIDFRLQQVNLGGTYVPASGLNQAIGGILGPLTGGPQGEGLFGITFAVQGALANPQVIVNPLSLLGPGIFREIFQMTPENFKVTPRPDTPPAAASGPAAGRPRPKAEPSRASSAGEVRAPAAAPSRLPGEVINDWTSDVKPAPKRPVQPEPAQR